MFGSEILEVVIGLFFIYLLISLLCSAIVEWVSTIFNWRSDNLRKATNNLLNDSDGSVIAEKVLNHPLIQGMKEPEKINSIGRKETLPDYIPPRIFAIALLEVIESTDDAGKLKSLNDIRATVANIKNDNIKQTLLPLINHGGNELQTVKKAIEQWFDESMDRASGWYKRKSQFAIAILATIFTIGMNIDTVMVSQTLMNDRALRVIVTAAAEKHIEKHTAKEAKVAVQQSYEQLKALKIPIGWSCTDSDPRAFPQTLSDFFIKLLGLLITSIAVSMGAPFWFDVLNKLVSLRSTGKAPARSSGGEV